MSDVKVIRRRRPPEQQSPWKTPVPYGEATLRCRRWPSTDRAFRGAVCAVLDSVLGGDLHVDWHGHDAQGGNAHRPAPICFRSHGPSVFSLGPRAHEHMLLIAKHLHALRLPRGEVIEVQGADLRLDEVELQVHKEKWFEYELVTPIFPSESSWGRRPRQPGEARKAWASSLIAGSITQLCQQFGVEPAAHRPVWVRVFDYEDAQVQWGKGGRVGKTRWGPKCRFVSNTRLPDGCGLGSKRAYGFGEVRCVGR